MKEPPNDDHIPARDKTRDEAALEATIALAQGAAAPGPTSVPIISLAQLLADVRRHELLDARAQAIVEQEILPRFSDLHAVARALVQRNLITPYQVNQLVNGRGRELRLGSYILLERLGEGGMGQVFKARHVKLDKLVALKLIRPECLQRPGAVRRFRREIQAAAQLDHPHVIRAYDADEVEGRHYFVMELGHGIDLARKVRQDGPLPVALACAYIRQAALGLQHAHERGLVHRDIKPGNLLLVTPQQSIKILDMGLALVALAADEPVEAGGASATSMLTQDGKLLGTPDFVAPEQTLDPHNVDIRADLYSLGCTLFFLITGQVPFPGRTLGERIARHQTVEAPPLSSCRQDIPPVLEAIVRRLLAKKPEARYQTPAELAGVLRALLDTLPDEPQAAPNLVSLSDFAHAAEERTLMDPRTQEPLDHRRHRPTRPAVVPVAAPGPRNRGRRGGRPTPGPALSARAARQARARARRTFRAALSGAGQSNLARHGHRRARGRDDQRAREASLGSPSGPGGASGGARAQGPGRRPAAVPAGPRGQRRALPARDAHRLDPGGRRPAVRAGQFPRPGRARRERRHGSPGRRARDGIGRGTRADLPSARGHRPACAVGQGGTPPGRSSCVVARGGRAAAEIQGHADGTARPGLGAPVARAPGRARYGRHSR